MNAVDPEPEPAEPVVSAVDRLIAEVVPTLSPATVRSALGWPESTPGRAPGESGGTGWPE